MAVYLHIFTLLVNKTAVSEKYKGGIEKFREDYNIPLSEINQEDDELFALGQMNPDLYDIDKLISEGLSFDSEKQSSDDFTILYRYGDFFWEVNWLKHNKVFAWHINTADDVLKRVDEISNMHLERIIELAEEGRNPLVAIRSENL